MSSASWAGSTTKPNTKPPHAKPADPTHTGDGSAASKHAPRATQTKHSAASCKPRSPPNGPQQSTRDRRIQSMATPSAHQVRAHLLPLRPARRHDTARHKPRRAKRGTRTRTRRRRRHHPKPRRLSDQSPAMQQATRRTTRSRKDKRIEAIDEPEPRSSEAASHSRLRPATYPPRGGAQPGQGVPNRGRRDHGASAGDQAVSAHHRQLRRTGRRMARPRVRDASARLAALRPTPTPRA